MLFSPQWRKKILKFLKVFNVITFPLIVILFIVCIIQDIPLKYIFSFIILYSVTMSISLIFDTKKHIHKSITEEYRYMFLIGLNIVIYIMISLLINRYQLDEYRIKIYAIILWILNITYLEFHKKYIYRIFIKIIKNPLWKWILRTIFLIITSGIVFMIWNSINGMNIPDRSKHSSEVTGVLSTIDATASGETSTSTTTTEERMPWESMWRFLGIGNSGEDVLNIQKYLFDKWYYTGALSGNYDDETAMAINRYIEETTGEVFTRPEFGSMKLSFLKMLSTESTTIPEQPSIEPWQEATWTLTTAESENIQSWSIQIDSIQSVDSGATATIKDWKIVVQVVSPQQTINSSDNWEVTSKLSNIRWAGWLQGVVIWATKSTPAPGDYDAYQSITFSAEWASGIFFTADGSDPSCQWKWITKLVRKSDSITIKTISCYWWNKIRWPISSYTFTLKK